VEATLFQGERTARNYAFVNAVARTNVELAMTTVRSRSPVLAGLEKAGTIDIVGAMYNLDTGAVEFFG
jgi:carbonic anhydrase